MKIETIQRNKDVIYDVEDLEHLYTFSKFQYLWDALLSR